MSRETFAAELTTVFHQVFSDDSIELSDTMTAADYEPWDSLNHIMLIMGVEKAFSLKFSNAEIARLVNVGDLLDLIEKKKS